MTLVPESEVREALSAFRVDAIQFEEGVRARVAARATSALSSNGVMASGKRPSAALQAAAAFLPLEILSGGQLTGAALRLAPATGVKKLLGLLAFPAVSLFLLVGATIFSVAKIRGIQKKPSLAPTDDKALSAATTKWWRDHKLGVIAVFAVSLILSLFGLTWLLFLGYIVSLGMLTVMLNSLAKVGLGNRVIVGQSCAMALVFLGQMSGISGIGDQDLRLIDQGVTSALFWLGVIVVWLVVVGSQWRQDPAARSSGLHRAQRYAVLGFAIIVLPLVGWFLNPILWPATPARIVAYVESFERARFSTASWREWEIVASWTVDEQLNPDFTRPRKLLAAEIAGEQNPFILGDAFRVGLVKPPQIEQLREYPKQRRMLLDDKSRAPVDRPIQSIEQTDWVIRAALMRDDVMAEQRDYLEQRLLATLEAEFTSPYSTLKTPLRVTQLLQAIGRPVDVDRYRERMHEMLLSFHSTHGGGFQPAGGFRDYHNVLVPGSLDATNCAVELMAVYGIPEKLDVNWVRCYLRPQWSQFSPYKWMAAVTRDRLNDLPGVTRPTWLQLAYYERSLLAAMVLIGLSVYATAISPMPKPAVSKPALD
jgi:hypothetical protein